MEYLFLLLWWRFSPLLPRRPMLSAAACITNWSIIMLTQAATGWVVARTHRAYQVPMVFVFLVCDLLWYVWSTFSWAEMIMIDSIDQPRFRPYLAYYLTNVF